MQGKSALWSHLVSYLEVEECKSSGKPIDPNFLTPGKFYVDNAVFYKMIVLISIYTGNVEDVKSIHDMSKGILKTYGLFSLFRHSNIFNNPI